VAARAVFDRVLFQTHGDAGQILFGDEVGNAVDASNVGSALPNVDYLFRQFTRAYFDGCNVVETTTKASQLAYERRPRLSCTRSRRSSIHSPKGRRLPAAGASCRVPEVGIGSSIRGPEPPRAPPSRLGACSIRGRWEGQD
jgi:hypothetical protein